LRRNINYIKQNAAEVIISCKLLSKALISAAKLQKAPVEKLQLGVIPQYLISMKSNQNIVKAALADEPMDESAQIKKLKELSV